MGFLSIKERLTEDMDVNQWTVLSVKQLLSLGNFFTVDWPEDVQKIRLNISVKNATKNSLSTFKHILFLIFNKSTWALISW